MSTLHSHRELVINESTAMAAFLSGLELRFHGFMTLGGAPFH